jgi:hypothetical protein
MYISYLLFKLPEWFVSHFSIADGQHEVGDRGELVQVQVIAAGQLS